MSGDAYCVAGKETMDGSGTALANGHASRTIVVYPHGLMADS